MKVSIEKKGEKPLGLDAEMKAIQLEIKKQIDSLKLQREGDNNQGYENRIVKEEELQTLLNEGWQFVAPMNNGKHVLRRLRSNPSDDL